MDRLPVFNTRAMKQEFINHYGLLMTGAKPYMLRSIHRELTKDASCFHTSQEQEVDQRVQEALRLEDVDIVVDLREMNEGREAKYELFWIKCSEFISECTAVQERCHGDICFMATVISVRDLIAQVS